MRLAAPLVGLSPRCWLAAVLLQLADPARTSSDEYIVPLPTDIARQPAASGDRGARRWRRFLLTAGETLRRGVARHWWSACRSALLLHRSPRLRRAFEPWVAALAAAPLVLAYPLFLVLFGRSPADHRGDRLRRPPCRRWR